MPDSQVLSFGIQWPESKLSLASDQLCDLDQVPVAPFDLGFFIHTRGMVMLTSHCHCEVKNERLWIQVPAAL